MVARQQGQLRPDQIEALKESFGLSDAPLWEQ
jgi:peptide/nickel transport system permease protein